MLTAVAIGSADSTRRDAIAISVSHVRFAEIPRATIEHYVNSGEPFGKAGAYAVQGQAASYISHISGSFSGIMGLPVFETAALLRLIGWKI